MLYAASSRRGVVLRHHYSRRAIATPPLSGQSSRPGSALSRRKAPDDFQTFQKPTTPYKSKDRDRVKELEKMFLLSEQELDDFYRSFCLMARKNRSQASTARGKSNSTCSKSLVTANIETTSSSHPHRPWEDKTERKVTLSLFDFFATFNLANGGFYDAIFELVGIKDFHTMTFSEFLDGVLTYSFFTNDDMTKFVFFIVDKKKEGKIPRFQLLRLLESLHCKNNLMFQKAILSSNVESSSIDYAAVKRLFADYPSMLEPAFRLQNTMRCRIMGEKFWRKKYVQMYRSEKVRECEQRQDERILLREQRGKIRWEVGWLTHCFRRESCGEMAKKVESFSDDT